ncbi:MAG: acyltransferase family protein, partial [Enterococcus sp.]|nr:acyltransferase family protein [Enterococcus sp.]
MTSDNKQRLVWIDYAKVCSMVLVVFYHTPPQLGAIDTVVGLMRLPAFFLVAGFLFKVEKFDNLWQLVLHRSKQLLVPYFFFFAVFYVIWLLFGRDMAGDTDVEIYEPIIEFVTGRPQTICAPMWFVVCLFSIQIIYYIL